MARQKPRPSRQPFDAEIDERAELWRTVRGVMPKQRKGAAWGLLIEYRPEASCGESVDYKKVRHLRDSQSAKRCGKNSLHAGADRRRFAAL